jgi:hypothetical protein
LSRETAFSNFGMSSYANIVIVGISFTSIRLLAGGESSSFQRSEVDVGDRNGERTSRL